MIFSIDKSIPLLQNTPLVIHHLLNQLSNEWVLANEGADTWNVKEIIAHLIVCEETDWIVRATIILSDQTPKQFAPINMHAHFEIAREFSLPQLIKKFTNLRQQNLATLEKFNIQPVELTLTAIHPVLGEVSLQQLLSAWVVHDLTHLAQITRVMAKLYEKEVGPFKQLLGVLNK